MKNIFITGSSGFVGTNLLYFFQNKYFFNKYNRHTQNINIESEVFIHLAGKAHDLKNTSNYKEYYEVNTDFTIHIFERFLKSNASVFIYLSSVKAVADNINGCLTEESSPNPLTHYGKSKLIADKYILSKIDQHNNKRIYILRPAMIYGPNNKGNFNLLYNLIKNRIPWTLTSFENCRSFCYIENLLFVIDELITNSSIKSGIYNISDTETLSTNKIVDLIANSLSIRIIKLRINKKVIKFIAKIGDIFNLPINSEKLSKLTSNYIVSNKKILSSIEKKLPYTATEGFISTLEYFKKI